MTELQFEWTVRCDRCPARVVASGLGTAIASALRAGWHLRGPLDLCPNCAPPERLLSSVRPC